MLKAAFLANVSRVVLTSSTAAVVTYPNKDRIFTEADWGDAVSSNMEQILVT